MRHRRKSEYVAVCLVAALAGGCGRSDGNPPPEAPPTTAAAVDPAEADPAETEVFTDGAGASVAIPTAALPVEPVGVATLDDPNGLPPTGDPEGFAGGIRLEPHGHEFAEPVTITIPLTRQQPPGRQLKLFYWDGMGTAWEETEFVAVVHDDGWAASGEVTHFSYYVLIPSQAQADADGIFGNLLEAVSVATSGGAGEIGATEAVFSTMIGNVNTRFPLHQRVLLDVPIPNGRNCYAPVGYYFLFDHARPVGLEEPLTRETGDSENVEFRVDYVRDVDIIVKMGEVENQVVGTLVANIYWRSLPPEMSLTADREVLTPGESATLRAELTCGDSPMGNEEVAFSDPSGLGTLVPATAQTDGSGAATTVFSPGFSVSGTAVVAAEHDWTNQRGDITLLVSDSVEIAIRTVTGTWAVRGSETWRGCTDPEDDGTYQGSGDVYFLEDGGTISGFGEFPRTTDVIVGTIVWSGNSFTLRGTSNYREVYQQCADDPDCEDWIVTGTADFTGTGSLASRSIDFTWDGQDLAGDTCSFTGRGTATRESP